GASHRQTQPVGVLVDQDEVADLQRRNHGAGRNLKGFYQEGTQDQHDEQDGEEGLGVLDQHRLLFRHRHGVVEPALACLLRRPQAIRRGAALRCQQQPVEQRDGARDCDENQEYQRKIDIHLTVNLENSQEGFLGNFNIANLLHAFLAGLLFLQQLLLAAHVAAVAFGSHVLAQGLDRLTGNDLAADCRLNGHIIHLTGNQFLHFFHQQASFVVGLVTMHDKRERINTVAVDQHIQTDQIGRLEADEVIVQRRIAATGGFELVEEVEHHLVHRQFVAQGHLTPNELHVALHTTTADAQVDYAAQV